MSLKYSFSFKGDKYMLEMARTIQPSQMKGQERSVINRAVIQSLYHLVSIQHQLPD